jgi:hypothetical protein
MNGLIGLIGFRFDIRLASLSQVKTKAPVADARNNSRPTTGACFDHASSRGHTPVAFWYLQPDVTMSYYVPGDKAKLTLIVYREMTKRSNVGSE